MFMEKIRATCLSIERLCAYAEGNLSLKERGRIEEHLSRCCFCLDTLVSIHDGNRYINNRRRHRLKKENIFLVVAVLSFLLSFIFSRYFLQFLAATIILGTKWIVESKNSKLLIMIKEAYKGSSRLPKERDNIDFKKYL